LLQFLKVRQAFFQVIEVHVASGARASTRWNGATIVGGLLTAIVVSLPELVTTTATIRRGPRLWHQ
jgi:hypothetical protein